jgi:hypothetical protein
MIDPVEFGKAMGSLIREATAPLVKRIEELEARELLKGDKGDTGDPGKDAEPVLVSDVVKELIVCPDLNPILDLLVTEAVSKYLEENPAPAGKDGSDGKDGAPGRQGEKGRDGLDVKDLFRAEGGRLMAVLSDGTTKDLGEFVGKDGEKGQDGKDGLGFDDFSADYDGERTVTLKWVRGEQVKSYAWTLPVVIHKGFWREGMEAKQGDSMTHAGSLWIALRDTKAAPGYDAKEDWILAARKGRDGDKGDPGTPPAPKTVKLHD